MKTKNNRRICSILLVIALMVTMLPASVFGADAIDLEWWNFRNNAENNGVTDRPTPTSDLEVSLKWAQKYGTGWSAAPTPPLILDDHLYIGSANKVYKLNRETGAIVAESDTMAGNVGYAMNPILYADGKLFVQIGNGVVQALDYETLQCVWKTESVGGQTVSPLSYAEVDGQGYVYTGTWTGESADGTFFCFSTDDSKVADGIKQVEWKLIPSGTTTGASIVNDPDLLGEANAKRGFYWAGAYANENYIAVGSDDGTAEGDYTANAVFYTLNPTTGAIIDKVSGIKGDIRTTAVYNNGYLYFSTKGGQLYKISVSSSGDLGEPSYIDLEGMTTASPLVHNNKIYIGVCGPGGQFDPDGGHTFAVVNNTGILTSSSLMYKLPIQGYPQASALLSTANENVDYDGDGSPDGRVYIYFTYNAYPGGIYYTYDAPNQTGAALESKELFVPDTSQQNYCISTICADREGTLYYKNDTGNLFAVEPNEAYLNDITVKNEAGTPGNWDTAFDSKKSGYTVKLPAGSTQASITLDLITGSAATVSGAAYQNSASVALNGDQPVEVKVKITKGADTRTYTFTLMTESDNSSLTELKVNNSNSGTSSLVTLDPAFASGTYDYIADVTNVSALSGAFYNVWPYAPEGSTVKVYGVENVDPSRLSTEGAITGIYSAGTGSYRYPVYFDVVGKTMKVRVEVTSESGNSTSSYNLTLLKKVSVTGVAINYDEHDLYEGETLQLNATVYPEDATTKTVEWYSLDEDVATINENGLVTAKKAGTTTITAITDDAGKTAQCRITVKEPPRYDITANAAQNGQISVSTKSAVEGTVVTITVDPDEGYRLATLSAIADQGGKLVLTKISDSKYSFVLPDSEVNVSADFEAIPVPLYNIGIEAMSGGDVELSTSSSIEGTVVTITVATDDGYSLTTLSAVDASGETLALTKIADSQYSFTMPGSDVTVSAVFAKIPKVMDFTDVISGKWYYSAVDYVFQNDLMNGITDTLFKPNDPMQRSMFVTVVGRMDRQSDGAAVTKFTDVKQNSYYANHVKWGTNNDIIKGISNSEFAPGNKITREQVAAIIVRYAEYLNIQLTTSGFVPYSDFDDVSTYAKDAVKKAQVAGIMTGKPGNKFEPKANISRAEAAQMLMNFIENVK